MKRSKKKYEKKTKWTAESPFPFSSLILGNAVGGGCRALCQYTFGIRRRMIVVWMWSTSSKQTRMASSDQWRLSCHYESMFKNKSVIIFVEDRYFVALPPKCNSQSYFCRWLFLVFNWSVFRPNGFERGEQMRSPRWSVIPSFICAASSPASPSPTSSTSPGRTNDSAPSTRKTQIPRGKDRLYDILFSAYKYPIMMHFWRACLA